MKLFQPENIRIRGAALIPPEADAGEVLSFSPALSTWELIWFLSGENTTFFGEFRLVDRPGCIRYLPKSPEYHRYDVSVHQPGSCIDIRFEAENLPPEPFSRDYSASPRLQSLFLRLHRIWQQKGTGYYAAAMSLFYAILAEMEQTDTRYAARDGEARLRPAIEYIHAHYCDPDFRQDCLPQMCSMGYTWFKKLFLQTYRMLPCQYVRELRLGYARELLATGRMTVSRIAEACGYTSIGYFSRVFKDAFGVPPSDYTDTG